MNKLYFDYSATTKPSKEVLETYNKVNNDYWYNANSMYEEGIRSKQLIEASSDLIAKNIGVKSYEIIYTSSASEANTQAIIGYALRYNAGEIITTPYEHESVIDSLNYLKSLGYTIKEIPLKDNKLDLDKLKTLITDNTILVTTAVVSSESGIVTDIKSISEIIRKFPRCKYHVDAVQAFTKIDLDLKLVDSASFSFHKIFGLKGIAFLYKNEKLELNKIIRGGDSVNKYRSGTPDTAMIAALAKGIKLEHINIMEKFKYVKKLNDDLRLFLKEYPNILINSPEDALPHILNISFKDQKGEVTQRRFSSNSILLSTRSACSGKNSYSKVIYNMYNDLKRAENSIRISLSYKTSLEDLSILKKTIRKIYSEIYK